jgi:hypothetical protein
LGNKFNSLKTFLIMLIDIVLFIFFKASAFTLPYCQAQPMPAPALAGLAELALFYFNPATHSTHPLCIFQ